MKVRNVSQGLRGLNTAEGAIWLEPGETADVQMSKGDEAFARKSGWFGFGNAATGASQEPQGGGAGSEGDGAPSGSETSADDARRDAAAALLDRANDLSAADLKKEAEALLGDETPNTKREIVEALRDLAVGVD